MSAGLVTQLQVKTTDLCRAYFTAIGHLQNIAPEAPLGSGKRAREGSHADCCRTEAGELAAEVVQIHEEIDGLIDLLEQKECSEEDQAKRARELQAELGEVTQQLEERTASAEKLQGSLRGALTGLLREVDGLEASVAAGRNV